MRTHWKDQQEVITRNSYRLIIYNTQTHCINNKLS
jgi:hypothetical protein